MLPGATGGSYFQNTYVNTQYAGQLSIEVEKKFISQPSPDQISGGIGGSEGYNHLADGWLTILDIRSAKNAMPLGGHGLTNLAGVGGNLFQTNFIGRGVHSAGKADFVKITLSWAGNTGEIYIDGLLHNAITLPPIGSANRLDFGQIAVGYSPPGSYRIQNFYIRNLVLASRPVTFPHHALLSKVVIYGDSFVSQANPYIIGTTHFDSTVGFQIIRNMNNRGFPIGQLVLKDYEGEVLNKNPAPGQVSFQLGTNRFGNIADKLTDVVNANADYVIIMGGTNDATGDAATRGSVAPSFAADLLSMCRTILNNPQTKGVIVQTITSAKGNSIYTTPTYVANVAAVNAMIKALPDTWDATYPSNKGKVKVVDTFAATGGEAAAPNILKGTLNGALNDLHPAAFASVISANLIADALLDLLRAANVSPGFRNYKEVDYYWAQDPQRFQNLWQAARTQTIRIALLGDSQETSPGGRGSVYVPRLNYEMWKRFGNIPETPFVGSSSYGGGLPWGDWMLRGSAASPGPSASRLASNQILPNMSPMAHSTINGANNINGEWFGQLTMLQQDAIDVDPGAAIPATVSYFNTSGVVKARIFAATNASSGEIAYWAKPSNSHIPSYYETLSTTGSLILGLESGMSDVKAGDTAALQYNGKHYMAIEVAGTDDSKLTDVLGLRFFNESYPDGVIVNSFSAGGYKATDFLANHGDAGEIFRALDFQAVILHYGANDIGANLSAHDFKTQIESVIALIRSWIGNHGLPVILIADVYRNELTAAQASEYDQYVGAQLAIAQADSNVMVINARRLMDEIGWNGSSGQINSFLIDCCHYTPYGAQLLAAAETAAIMGEIPPQPSSVLVSPVSGSFVGSVDVTMTSPIANAVIYYTLDGSDPTETSTRYTGSFTLTQNTELKARAYLGQYYRSQVATASFSVQPPATQPASRPAGGKSGGCSIVQNTAFDPVFLTMALVAWIGLGFRKRQDPRLIRIVRNHAINSHSM
jgi:lysophospholipase L1-like esterase